MDRYMSIKNVYGRDGELATPEFEYLKSCHWQFTEKIDGRHIRIILDEKVDVRGRNDETYVPRDLLNYIYDVFDCNYNGEELCLYGEGIGGWESRYGSDSSFVLFDVMTKHGWASRNDIVDIAKRFYVSVVPVVFEGSLLDAVRLTQVGLKSMYGGFFAEGMVGRPMVDLRDQYGNRIMTKVNHEDFYGG